MTGPAFKFLPILNLISRYFKPVPRWDKQTGVLYLPKSCPVQSVCVQGDKKTLKNIACLEACKQLHKIGALTDNLVPDIVMEEASVADFGKFIPLVHFTLKSCYGKWDSTFHIIVFPECAFI